MILGLWVLIAYGALCWCMGFVVFWLMVRR